MLTITLGANTYTLIPLPSAPGFTDISVTMMDSVAKNESPFVPSQVQTQSWPGADGWGIQLSLPKMHRKFAGEWVGFLAGMRGMQNVVQIGDPLGVTPQGRAAGAPVCSTSGSYNALSSTNLVTRGWAPNQYGALKAGDYIQIGNRLHQNTQDFNIDGSGYGTMIIWPSLREVPADGTAIKLVGCQGVFRLASNMRKWHSAVDQLFQINIPLVEVR